MARPHPAGDGQARRPLDRRRDQFHRRATRSLAATGARSSIIRSCISRSAITRRSTMPSRTGSQRVEAGAQGEHKLARGYVPVTTYSAHYIADPALAPRDRRLSQARARLCGRGRPTSLHACTPFPQDWRTGSERRCRLTIRTISSRKSCAANCPATRSMRTTARSRFSTSCRARPAMRW